MPEGGTGGEHDHLRERNGQQVTVTRRVRSDETPVYHVKFPDGTEYTAFEDEIDGTHEHSTNT
jgi:hypothetical protein